MRRISYSALSEKFRSSAPSDFQCTLFCGGRRCKYESAKKWSTGDMAVPGLYSHWVTHDVLAMSRPNNEMIVKSNIIQSFKEFVSSIIGDTPLFTCTHVNRLYINEWSFACAVIGWGSRRSSICKKLENTAAVVRRFTQAAFLMIHHSSWRMESTFTISTGVTTHPVTHVLS